MTFRRRTSALLLAVATAATLTAFTSDTPAPRATTRTTVLGYIESGDGLTALRRNLPALGAVAIDGINISAKGDSVSSVDPGARAMLVATHRAGKRADLLIGNYSSGLGDFDPAAAHRLFASAANRHAVIASLVSITRSGWDGIHLDLESLRSTNLHGLTQFTTQLRAALPSTKTLSMAVMASTTAQGYRDTAYDLPALARQVTHVVLMAYDEHGPGWSGPGAIGGLPWVRQSLHALLHSVPRSKVVLGVAGYGYTWHADGTGQQLGDSAARSAARNGHVAWDATQGEWHARFANGTRLWWSDAKSLRIREDLARTAGVDGVAVWSLGLSDVVAR